MPATARPFDRAAWLAAQEPPRFLDGETEYVGQVLSAPEWWVIEAKIEAAGTLDGRGVAALMRGITDEIFPPPERSHWWEARPPSVADLLFQMPLPAQFEAFRSFVAALATIHRTVRMPGTTPGLSPKTTGTDSPR